jgi:shikimate dehydrogenase
MNSKRPTSEISAPETTVFSLEDLAVWPWEGVSLAVLGYPVKHSISPAMHNAALRAMAAGDERFRSWRYFKFAVPPEDLPRALSLLHERQFLGINLTIPHKILALDLVAKIDPAAAGTGAVNTLKWSPAGYEGFNTDSYGLARGIEEELGVEMRGRDVVLLGAGGAARAAAVLALQERCGRLFLGNRTVEKLAPLRSDLLSLAGDIPVEPFALDDPPRDLRGDPIVVNATSAGLRHEDAAPVDLKRFPRGAVVYDMIYNPSEPVLVREARSLGMRTANGLSMLIYQGVRALEIWSGDAVPSDEMGRAARAAMA